MTSGHEIWHVTVLAVSLLGAAATALVLLAPLVFDAPPEGFARARPYLVGLGCLAAALLTAEWLGVH